MVLIDFEVNWSKLKITVTFNNIAVGVPVAYTLSMIIWYRHLPWRVGQLPLRTIAPANDSACGQFPLIHYFFTFIDVIFFSNSNFYLILSDIICNLRYLELISYK